MSIPLKLGTTTKRVNSTAVPDSTNWTNYDVRLKLDTSLERPVFVLQASASTLAGYNYAVGAGLLYGFYWIVDIVSIAESRCEVHCVRDVLANNRAAIMATSAFIEYGFNTFDAGDSTYRVSDHRQTISETPTQYTASVDPSGGKIGTGGRYVLQVVGSGNGVRTYLADETALKTLISQINSDLGTEVDNIINSGSSPDQQLASLASLDLKRSLLQDSAINAIKSCHWVPVFPPEERQNVYILETGTAA